MSARQGAQVLCQTLERLGAKHIFGLPGTQNIGFFEAIRQSKLEAVVPCHELAAAFMANGYFRASGQPGILTTIPGPGMAYVVAALAEAAHDSAAVLYVLEKPETRPGRKFTLQYLDQEAILSPIVKKVIAVEEASEIAAATELAYSTSLSGEPGPVVLHIAKAALQGHTDEPDKPASVAGVPVPDFSAALDRLAQAQRPILHIGQGAVACADVVRKLAEKWNVPVVTTRSGRGILPENHRLSLRYEVDAKGAEALNALVDASDLVVAVGCKFTHNGTFGFRLKLPPERLIHVDTSELVLQQNYPASIALCADARDFFTAAAADPRLTSKAWTVDQIQALRANRGTSVFTEPVLHGIQPANAAAFFAALRQAMPDDAYLVTDTGLHQVLATRYFEALTPRGFLTPTDFQSMGFGLPAAIAAKIANPGRKIVALIGDGGLLMSGMDLATAVREGIDLTVIVFNDGAYGQIRAQQHSSYGMGIGTDLLTPQLDLLAGALGANYLAFDQGSESLRQALETKGVTIVDVRVGDSVGSHIQRAAGVARTIVRRLRSR